MEKKLNTFITKKFNNNLKLMETNLTLSLNIVRNERRRQNLERNIVINPIFPFGKYVRRRCRQAR